jgi:hypothetical protein
VRTTESYLWTRISFGMRRSGVKAQFSFRPLPPDFSRALTQSIRAVSITSFEEPNWHECGEL